MGVEEDGWKGVECLGESETNEANYSLYLLKIQAQGQSSGNGMQWFTN